MRQSQDMLVGETVSEVLDKITLPKFVHKRRQRGQYGKQKDYADITCTLDIETTNTDDDGFLYTIQGNIGGVNFVYRYINDFVLLIDAICDRWNLTENRRIVLYVHNLGYEFMYLSQILAAAWGIKKALYTARRKPLYIEFFNGIELRDSFKLFQKSLARATEGCPHEKLAGDLDYNIYRTPDTELTQQEFNYCVNDVQGLFEAIERLKQEHKYNQATIPYTNTGMVIDEVNKGIDYTCKQKMRKLDLSKEQMYIAYKAMAGGDTHGCRWRAGITYKDCNSYDFKSAHPSQQLLRPFPAGAPQDLPKGETDEETLQVLIQEGYGWVCELYIQDFEVRPECPDPVISVSKCKDIAGNAGEDNGRLLGADGAILYCDSNDYQRIIEAYTYDKIRALRGFYFRLAPLPDSFRKTILEKFRIKETMKGSPDYMFSKVCVNTIFGACAQKTIRDEYIVVPAGDMIHTDSIKWDKNLAKKTESEVSKSQKNKYPFLWGLWTSSCTRLELWKMLKIVGWQNVIYWDTDSCKFEGAKCPQIEQYNRGIRNLCQRAGAVVPGKKGPVYIGVAEDEHPGAAYGYAEFRFLHAKCYAARDYTGKLESTIAGVGKKNGVTALKDDINNLDIGLVIEDAGGLALSYHDAPIRRRTEWSRPTYTASWIVMTPRRYDMGGLDKMIQDNILDFEITG